MNTLPGKLLLARHHESEWNKLGLWTGSRDRRLTEYGFKKALEMGKLIEDVFVDHGFASMLVRSIETLSSMLTAKGQFNVPTEHSAALNEREYGDYTGKNKWDMQKLVGEETWEKIRRNWDYPVPNGETLKMVYARTIPFFETRILPLIARGENVLVVAHGNSCRALMKYIEKISDEDIAKIEMPFGGILIYQLDEKGHIGSKEIRQVESSVNA
jgi:2,3-bisphosphoglycerate-dependent phosphoglycerate mutase